MPINYEAWRRGHTRELAIVLLRVRVAFALSALPAMPETTAMSWIGKLEQARAEIAQQDAF
jgi:hypothetical protein